MASQYTPISNGALLLARLHHEAMQRASAEDGWYRPINWSAVDKPTKLMLGRAMQLLVDDGVFTTLTLSQFESLKEMGWFQRDQ